MFFGEPDLTWSHVVIKNHISIRRSVRTVRNWSLRSRRIFGTNMNNRLVSLAAIWNGEIGDAGTKRVIWQRRGPETDRTAAINFCVLFAGDARTTEWSTFNWIVWWTTNIFIRYLFPNQGAWFMSNHDCFMADISVASLFELHPERNRLDCA